MEDLHKYTHSVHHNGIRHTRPIFHVQPPTQPFYVYQWNMNRYGQYTLSVSALPCMCPYALQYPYEPEKPEFVTPLAPFQSNCSSTYTQRSPAASNFNLRQHNMVDPQQPHRIRRETASSEVQTEDETLNMLIGNIERLSTNETPEKEKATPTEKGKKTTSHLSGTANEEVKLPEVGLFRQRRAAVDRRQRCQLPPQSHPSLQNSFSTPEEPKINFSSLPQTNSSAVQELNNTASSQSYLDEEPGVQQGSKAQHDTWSLGLGTDVQPMDSSSIIEEDEAAEQCCHERQSLASRAREDCEECEALKEKYFTDPPLENAHHCGIEGQKRDLKIGPVEHPPPKLHDNQGLMGRSSVLIPSIEELSSRDELFSTDLDDDLVLRSRDLSTISPGDVGGCGVGYEIYERKDLPEVSGKENNAPGTAGCTPEICAKTCLCCGMSMESNDEAMEFTEGKGERLAAKYMESVRSKGMYEDQGQRGEMGAYNKQQNQGLAWSTENCLPAPQTDDKYKLRKQSKALPRTYHGRKSTQGLCVPSVEMTFLQDAFPTKAKETRNDYDEREVAHLNSGSIKRRGAKY